MKSLSSAYSEFFKSCLKKYEIRSPAELNEEERSQFFTEVKKGWAKEKAALEASSSQAGDYESLSALSVLQKGFRAYFRKLLKKYKAKRLRDLTMKEKSELFTTVKKEWKKERSALLRKLKISKSKSESKQERELSPLQQHYLDYFAEKLKNDYDATKLSELDSKQKSKFFKSIKKEWKNERRRFEKRSKLKK